MFVRLLATSSILAGVPLTARSGTILGLHDPMLATA